jgi:hypothetical protein
MSDLSYYAVRLVDDMIYYVDQATGEQLKEKLLQVRNGDQSPVFIEFDDVSGTDVTCKVTEIESMYLSTPLTRERDESGTFQEIQTILDETRARHKKWDEEE